jgi:catechol 2,3-dioxygenase-like lactoylglutathione lyase family enzyme
MSEFQVTGLDHVTVTTPEELEDEVVTWYRDCLGLTQIEKLGQRPGGAWFEAGGQEIHVTRDPHNPSKTAHFGLRVDDFDAVVARLRSEKCHIEQAHPIPGRTRCFTRDPAGNSVEIVSHDEETGRVTYEEENPE